ncbi:syntaxin-5 [Cloeon dipterum]|uniref:syntaxin-5 n=1 Tax=Cloeon dipterum TaxID=197152 RepID=UPI00322059A1
MTTRRRRGGSESEGSELLGPSSSSWTSQTHHSNGLPPLEAYIDPTMASRDRTKEFFTTAHSLQGRELNRMTNTAVRDPRRQQNLHRYAEFMIIARNIGKNISGTYAKLEKLTLLAKKKSLFDDRPAEIQELTYIIKEDLNSLNQQIAKLQGAAKSQQDNSNRKHLMSHSSSVVLTLQSKLASMSSEFKNVLEVRTENLKAQRSRQEQFSQAGALASLPPSALTAGPRQGSVLLAEEQVSIEMGGLVAPPSLTMQGQRMLMQDESNQYLHSRAETMQNIESTIVELGGIFQQLAHMVKEQEEMVERIDTNIQDVELNVEAAHSEILKYFQSVSSNRWLMIKIFAVLILFFIFFVVFLA